MINELLKKLRVPRVVHFKLSRQHGFGYNFTEAMEFAFGGKSTWSLTISLGRHEWDIEPR